MTERAGLQERLAAIRVMVFDVDGVLTRGEIGYTDTGAEIKTFSAKDGLGLRVAGAAGIGLVLMTGRSSPIVERRARDLRIDDTLQRVGDKAGALRRLAAEKGCPLAELSFMGDDLNDREALQLAGVSFAPADAVAEIRGLVDVVTESAGGRGAAREAVETVLRAQGRWEEAVEQYLRDLSEGGRSRPGGAAQ